MRTMLRTLGVLSLAGTGLLLAGPAQADVTNDDFGQHVTHCAEMGLDGVHNPGTHEGITGWDAMHLATMP
ncbi:hypothetical protein [Intrasporangium calvum]|uniref:Uncharacterized protein n=1 Tax=Intrasporangium calvum (strain ATCC 23552 / DSM 43043 / JCM 3097 / NBRC 12989 / NCIMB 10167 / NRRL B-3866 / 7 KIP) TaxID=710696 RepID=E6SD22_INTC7|nr:hypothetical protein [Intrasporangium calvum]ADU48610.1 hypothetical protein Intca_2100 [Intrasporangium calvum DSM 43043]AXG15367.1 hypothetical protein DN585_09580 [Intrasporangium calvum]